MDARRRASQPVLQVTTLPSGMRVASQYTPDESLACLTLPSTEGKTDGDNVPVPGDCHSRRLDRCRQPLRDQGPCNLSTSCRHNSRLALDTSLQENNGTAHFLEHMAFKGTKRRNRIQLEQDCSIHQSCWRAWFAAGDRKHGGAPECVHLPRADGARPREPRDSLEAGGPEVYYAKCFKTDLRNGRGVGANRAERESLRGRGDAASRSVWGWADAAANTAQKTPKPQTR